MKRTAFAIILCCFLSLLLLSGCGTERSDVDSKKGCTLYFYLHEFDAVEMENARGETLSFWYDKDTRDFVPEGDMSNRDFSLIDHDVEVPFSETFSFSVPLKTDRNYVGVDFKNDAETWRYYSRQLVWNSCGTVVCHENNVVELYGDTTEIKVCIETDGTEWTVTGSGGSYAKIAVVDGEPEVEGLTEYEVKQESREMPE